MVNLHLVPYSMGGPLDLYFAFDGRVVVIGTQISILERSSSSGRCDQDLKIALGWRMVV